MINYHSLIKYREILLKLFSYTLKEKNIRKTKHWMMFEQKNLNKLFGRGMKAKVSAKRRFN